jgi:hypothetical protein
MLPKSAETETILHVHVESVAYNLNCFPDDEVHESGTRVEDGLNSVSLVDVVFSSGRLVQMLQCRSCCM